MAVNETQINESCADLGAREGAKYIHNICEADIIGVGFQPYIDVLGLVFPVIVVMFVFPPVYLISNDAAIPSTLMILLGTLVLQHLPGVWRTAGLLFIVVGFAIPMYIFVQRHRRDSGIR